MDYVTEEQEMNTDKETIIRTSGSHNCGGRCIIKAHVKHGKIIRITSDDEHPDSAAQPQLRGCLRCRGYREYLYHPDRLLHPLKRVGQRGEGKYVRISWDEALTTIAEHVQRIMHDYGPEAIFMQYATGNAGKASEDRWMKRLLALYGGYLGHYGTYSSACTNEATPYTYGTVNTGSSRDTWAASKVIILMGFNPAETIHGTNTAYYLKLAKKAGAKIIVIDPIYSDTAAALADQWIPIRPTTDSALLDAMAYVMITENLQDQHFLDTYCLGFDEEHMPPGIPAGHSYKSYILGTGVDPVPKTPAWAESITGISREIITILAREYALHKPGALIQGFGSQRHAYGEQPPRSAAALAAMTGNIGIAGGWASGCGAQCRKPVVGSIPVNNPCKAEISMYMWPLAIQNGQALTKKNGVRGVDRLVTDIKLIFNLGGNCLINQHSDTNGTAKLLADDQRVELIVVNDHFMTASAKFADIILPADNFMEREDIVTPWAYGDYVLFMNKAVDTVGECRNGYDWVGELADKLGLKDEFTEGKTQEEWLRYIVAETRQANPDFPAYEEFKASGVYHWRYAEPAIAFKEQIADPQQHPFPTPSGKIEFFSQRLWDFAQPEEIPAIPKYIPAWEGPSDPLAATFPLQCIGHHSKRRVHSMFDNTAWMEEAAPQQVWLSAYDAKQRGIIDGDSVVVYNERGRIQLPAHVTPRIMPGVVSVPQGAWWSPDQEGTDQRGCVNTLTKYQPTPLAFANPQHTNLVEVQKADAKGASV